MTWFPGPAGRDDRPSRAVLFDLDDTLFLQHHWLAGAWVAVARAAGRQGVDEARLSDCLDRVAAGGSDRGRIIDRALELAGVRAVEVAPLVAAFRNHRPGQLPCWPGAPGALARLRRTWRIGLVTDGDPAIQAAKLRALGLDAAFDVVVYSDRLGRSHRKPDPEPFRSALRQLDADAQAAVFIGDRPDKDVAGALGVGIRPIRVRTGEYAHLPDRPAPWASAGDVVQAIALVGDGAYDTVELADRVVLGPRAAGGLGLPW